MSPDSQWSDYAVTNKMSGRTYRVALQGLEPELSYCSCPDFRTNHLGTCKHLLKVIDRAERKFSKEALNAPYQRKRISVSLNYVGQRSVCFHLPKRLSPKVKKIITSVVDKPLDAIEAMRLIQALEHAGQVVHVYADAAEFIQAALVQQRLSRLATKVRKDTVNHELRTSLLKAPLLPYQLDDIAFAVGAGRAILADDMGLGRQFKG